MKAARYRMLELRGSPYDRGYGLGLSQRPIMGKLVRSVCESIASNTGLSRQGIIDFAAKQRPYIESYSPQVMSEVRGMAEGASVCLEELMVVVCSGSPKYNYRNANPTTGCTAFAARGNATSDGLSYIANTMDGPAEQWLSGESNAVWVYRQTDGPDVLLYDWPGFPGSAGVNSAGLALGGNALPYARASRGVPMSVVRREVMNQRSVPEAVEAIRRARRANAGNLLLADHNVISDVEAWPGGISVTDTDEIFCHANNFEKPTRYSGERLRSHSAYLENSASRCARADFLAGQVKGRIDLESAEAILRDHNRDGTQGGACLCRHADPGSGKYTERVRTYDAMVFIAEKREAWIARGNPCQAEFFRYSV